MSGPIALVAASNGKRSCCRIHRYMRGDVLHVAATALSAEAAVLQPAPVAAVSRIRFAAVSRSSPRLSSMYLSIISHSGNHMHMTSFDMLIVTLAMRCHAQPQKSLSHTRREQHA